MNRNLIHLPWTCNSTECLFARSAWPLSPVWCPSLLPSFDPNVVAASPIRAGTPPWTFRSHRSQSHSVVWTRIRPHRWKWWDGKMSWGIVCLTVVQSSHWQPVNFDGHARIHCPLISFTDQRTRNISNTKTPLQKTHLNFVVAIFVYVFRQARNSNWSRVRVRRSHIGAAL